MILGYPKLAATIARVALAFVVVAVACGQPAAAPSTPITTAAASASAAPSIGAFMTPEGYWTLGKVDAKVLFVDSSDFG